MPYAPDEFQNAFPDPTAPAPVLGVSALNRLAREVLEAALPLMWVGGEISNLVRAASGHVYFTLKDAQAQVRCAMWRGRAQLLNFRPENGMRVEARANVTLYEARGEFQLNVETLRPAGVGDLFEAFRKLKEKLAAEGLFDPARRRALPTFPRGVGVVTSAKAAALRDVLVTLRRRAPGLPVTIYPAAVQGAEAPRQLCAALETCARRAATDGVELVLLVRGGGGIEDLWAFNDEALARAIATCPLPVVSGVGHETDFTIADFVADARAPTPTGAAELASAGYFAARDALAENARRLRHGVERRLNELAQRVDRCALRLVHPRQRLQRAGEELDGLADRLRRAAQVLLGERRLRLDALAASLRHLGPQAVLARGYGIVRDAEGNVLRAATATQTGAALDIQLAEGRLAATVTGAH
ncbi:MAG: exodeoxyribonuclease VII large subunit [Azoarcus sp.]|jgi:exodeoxyribonuclease VII large subunit|nr:exodeoxyribonuclease VII large subunit [Azoarcus sp.]